MEIYNKEIFCRTMVINEALFGQSEKQLRMMMNEVNTEIYFDFHDFYLCLTGLQKKYYTSVLNMNRSDFIKIFRASMEQIEALASQQKITKLHAVINYDSSKQIVFLIKKENHNERDIQRFAGQIMSILEAEYQKNERYQHSGLANFTVLSDLIAGYDQMADEFEQLRWLSRLSFFDMRPAIIRKQDLQIKKADWKRVREKIDQLEELIFIDQPARLEEAVHDIFSRDLKRSFDFQLCYAVLNDLSRMLMKLNEQLAGPWQPEALVLRLETYASVEKAEMEILTLFLSLQSLASSDYHKMTPVTREALNWIKANYTRDIGLQETADHLGLTPAYLSRTFSRDLKITLNAYLVRLRIEQAKILLMETNDKISDVARQVGVYSAEYFSVLFKKNTGMRPQDYRDCYRR